MVKVPPGVSLEVAASIMTKGLTTFYLLHKTFVPRPNDTILFHAAAGGVGQIFCQWAKSLGCKVIGTVGSDEKVSMAKKNAVFMHCLPATRGNEVTEDVIDNLDYSLVWSEAENRLHVQKAILEWCLKKI